MTTSDGLSNLPTLHKTSASPADHTDSLLGQSTAKQHKQQCLGYYKSLRNWLNIETAQHAQLYSRVLKCEVIQICWKDLPHSGLQDPVELFQHIQSHIARLCTKRADIVQAAQVLTHNKSSNTQINQ